MYLLASMQGARLMAAMKPPFQPSALQIRAIRAIPNVDGGRAWQFWTALTHSMPGSVWLRRKTTEGHSRVTSAAPARQATPQGEVTPGTPNGTIYIGTDSAAWKLAKVATVKGARVIELEPVRHGVKRGDGLLAVSRGYVDLRDHLRGYDASNQARLVKHLDGTRVITVPKPAPSGSSSTPQFGRR